MHPPVDLETAFWAREAHRFLQQNGSPLITAGEPSTTSKGVERGPHEQEAAESLLAESDAPSFTSHKAAGQHEQEGSHHNLPGQEVLSSLRLRLFLQEGFNSYHSSAQQASRPKIILQSTLKTKLLLAPQPQTVSQSLGTKRRTTAG